ncbi:MAG: cyclic nucleotide-binding domain-containing protein [Deltaproteobacteria bacterium]|nr:cyclic nucleotide-binding domain-containing protein [Deltaproteobacteria bacterium]
MSKRKQKAPTGVEPETEMSNQSNNESDPNTPDDAPGIDEVLGAIDNAISDDDFQLDEMKGDGPSPEEVKAADAAKAAMPEPDRPPSIVLTPEVALVLVGKVNLFAGLPRVYLERIASLCVEQSYKYGQFVFREGQPGDSLYLILEGAVRISRQIPGMGEEALAVLKSGEYFGEMALIDDFPRSADACVHESCRLLVIGKEQLQDLLFVDRDLAYDLLWTFVRTLSGRLRQTNDKMTFMAVTSKF